MQSPLLDKAQAAEYLNVSVWSIEYMVRHRKIPFVRVSGQKGIRFHRQDLDTYIEDNRTEAI